METSQDDILQSTKTVIQGLDALKSEHGKILESLVETMQIESNSTLTHPNELNKLEEKAGLLRKSMDMIELGKTKQTNTIGFIFCFYSNFVLRNR